MAGKLQIQRGIEVGHVFYWVTLFEKLGAPIWTAGSDAPAQMAATGSASHVLLGRAIEQGHDERGIIWPIRSPR